MGQAFDKDGAILGEMFGQTKREVFDKLTEAHPDARLENRTCDMASESTARPLRPEGTNPNGIGRYELRGNAIVQLVEEVDDGLRLVTVAPDIATFELWVLQQFVNLLDGQTEPLHPVSWQVELAAAKVVLWARAVKPAGAEGESQ